jgi:hypothetical protein
MHRSVFAAALAVTLLPLASVAQTPAAPPAPKAAEAKPEGKPAKAYVPGLEQFMNVILM